MTVPPPPRAMVPLLAAVAGVVVAHAVDYAVVFPHAGTRDAHLDATGHGYWPVAVVAATAAAAVALLVAAFRGVCHGLATGRSSSRHRAWVSSRLGGLLLCQGGAFAVLEAGERGLAGLPPSVLLHSAEFWVGMALQLPVAWLALRLLDLVEDTAGKLAASRRAPLPRAACCTGRAIAVRVVTGLVGLAPARPRAPPLAFS